MNTLPKEETVEHRSPGEHQAAAYARVRAGLHDPPTQKADGQGLTPLSINELLYRVLFGSGTLREGQASGY